ncbi:MAG TPA: glycosyl hydrolase [Actinobacteria bacterium]|nr:glycosyl hydrolase [Actinomycetota bacterium]
MNYFLYYQYAVTFLLAVILINFVINNIAYKSPSRFKLPPYFLKKRPLVSVLIPARNEEKNIGRCLRSLIKQDYDNIEILVLDDNSDDATGSIVDGWSKKDSRIKSLRGEPLPSGWKGKSYACHQLSRKAKGDYLMFTDADTLHFPDSTSSAIAALLSNDLDALSIFPKQIMVTIHERMVVVFINLAIMAFMPLFLIKNTTNPILSIANGQFILFKRKTYDSIGGHENVKTDIVEDVAISRQIKKCGFKFMIFDGRLSVYCRMYKGFREVVRGFSKFIFASMNYSITKMVAVISLVMILFLIPLILFPIGSYMIRWPLIINVNLLIQISIILTIRIVMTFRFRSRIMDIVLHPLSMFYIMILSVNSVYQAKYGKGIYWKDRVYDISDGEELNKKKFDA